MKRYLGILLSACLLAGCTGPAGQTATAENADAAVPTAAPQTLTVSFATGRSTAAAKALEAYAEAQGVELQYNEGDFADADLVVLPEAPQDDGSWQNLASDTLLSAAASRAGMNTDTPVTALPLGKSLYAYWADSAVLQSLLGDGAAADLQNASWAEWSAFVQAVDGWLDAPSETVVTLNGKDYALPAGRGEAALSLNGVFAFPDPIGDAYLQDDYGALYTGALLAAGTDRNVDTLTGPLNGLYSALALEAANRAAPEPDREVWYDGDLLRDGNALFCRGYLSDMVAALDDTAAERLVMVPFKCDFVEEDLATQEYNLTGLMNYPVFSVPAWLAIPSSADAEGFQAAASAILWLYSSEAGERTLSEELCLVTPWNTASDKTAPGAMQINQLNAGILPGVTLSYATFSSLHQAHADSFAGASTWDKTLRDSWRQLAVAALSGTT